MNLILPLFPSCVEAMIYNECSYTRVKKSNVDLDNLQYARALKENGVAVEVIVFPKDNHPIDR